MTRASQLVWLVCCVACVSCGSPPAAQQVAIDDGQGGKVQWVDPNTIQPGPIRREALTDEQMARIRALQATFVEVDGMTVEKWVDDFKRDLNPDKELMIWEQMAKAYRAYCNGKQLSAEAKKDVYGIVLLRSMAPEPEVLQRVQLKQLTKEDAVEVMKGF